MQAIHKALPVLHPLLTANGHDACNDLSDEASSRCWRAAESRLASQALIDFGLVLNARQRQAIAGELAGAPRAFAGFHRPLAAAAARND